VRKAGKERIVPHPQGFDEVIEAQGERGKVPGRAAPLTARRRAVAEAQKRPMPVPPGFRADLPPSARQSREELREVLDLTQGVAAAEEREAREEGRAAQREATSRPGNSKKTAKANADARKVAALLKAGKLPKEIPDHFPKRKVKGKRAKQPMTLGSVYRLRDRARKLGDL
jgi:hypothetical protein